MKCEFPSGCDKELSADGFCPDHGNNKAWGPSQFVILLTERIDDGYSDGHDFSNKGVFSNLDKVKEALAKEHPTSNLEHFQDGPYHGRFKISAKGGLGSAFDYFYDYQTLGLDKFQD
jgi:hypothetical protein